MRSQYNPDDLPQSTFFFLGSSWVQSVNSGATGRALGGSEGVSYVPLAVRAPGESTFRLYLYAQALALVCGNSNAPGHSVRSPKHNVGERVDVF